MTFHLWLERHQVKFFFAMVLLLALVSLFGC